MRDGLLTDRKIKAAKPKATPYKLGYGSGDRHASTRGLYLLVMPTGSKLWRLKFTLDGREHLISLGSYPEVGLADATARCAEKRKAIAQGVDPVQQARDKAAQRDEERRALFAQAAESYVKKHERAWSETHRRDVRRMLDNELIPHLGSKPVASIATADIRKMLDAIVERGAVTYAHDVRTYYRAILHHFNAQRPRERRVSDESEYATLPKAPEETPHAALRPQDIGPFLRALAHSDATPRVRMATRFLLLTGVRTKNVREALWADIDEKARLWRVPRPDMKVKREHVVPLATQTLALLRDLRRETGDSDLLFPSLIDPTQPISDGTIINAIYRMGFKGKTTAHGLRSTFSGWTHEAGRFLSDAIERQLAHAPKDKVKAAYLRTQFLDERARMMQAWADFLDAAERDTDATVVLLHAKQA